VSPAPQIVQPELIQRIPSLQVARSLASSFYFAWQGVKYAFITQRNFRIDLAIAVLAITLSLGLHISAPELVIVCLTIALVLSLELLNTALEAVVDLTVGKTYHELAKIAKDCAAGSVLISAVTALVVAGILFVPRLYVLMLTLF
jgi:diacylglycerol kinase (ATP)